MFDWVWEGSCRLGGETRTGRDGWGLGGEYCRAREELPREEGGQKGSRGQRRRVLQGGAALGGGWVGRGVGGKEEEYYREKLPEEDGGGKGSRGQGRRVRTTYYREEWRGRGSAGRGKLEYN